MRHWLLKTEPAEYSYDDVEKDGRGRWDGVRNYEARNNLKAMAAGDLCFIYHSSGPREIVGIAEVTRAAYPDPAAVAAGDERWVCVDVKPVRRLAAPVTLDRIKTDKVLRGMAIVKRSRLSVAPVTARQWRRVLELAGE